MSSKPWLKSYPPGVPAEIDPDKYGSLVALFDASVERFGVAPAFSNLGETLSFADVDRLSRAFASYLQSVPGLGPGERVAVMLPNLLQSPVTVLGILRAGMVVVNVNPLYTVPELEHQLTDSGAKAIVVLENFAHTVADALPNTPLTAVVVTKAGDHCGAPKRWLVNFVVKYVQRRVRAYRIPRAVGYRTALASPGPGAFRRPSITGDMVAFLQYTGGTTGRAKGAMLTHRNMVSNTLQAAAWAAPFFDGSAGIVVTPLPLYHVYSLTANLLCFIELGGHNLLITDPRDVRGFIRELDEVPFAFMTGVNTLFNALLHTPGFAELDFSALRVCMGGGMAVQRDVATRWQAVTGVPIAQGYGLTEASPILSANPLDLTGFTGSVGVPFPSTEVAIFSDTGVALATGEVGEICGRGPQVMAGYWQRAEETAAVFWPDGWLRTGDLGRMDEHGFIFIEDRKKDVIVVSGFKVYPNEIEDVMTGHPGILEAAAIGIPDEQSGEAVKLFVVPKDRGLTEADVRSYARERLTGYKIPRVIEFLDELPKTNVGKVLRRALRDGTAVSQTKSSAPK
jgi:long-chain acyl-CoA synthetase